MSSFNFKFRFRKPANYFFIIPWIAFIPWWGMLVAMLACWAGQGHPIYWFMDSYQFPVFISDIGATNLRPLFISCAGWQGLGYCITLACEFFQRSGYWPFQISKFSSKTTADNNNPRDNYYNSVSSEYTRMMATKHYYMPPYYTKHERNLIIAAFFLAGIGELGLLFCSIFSTALYPHVHISMVSVFVAFLFLSTCCLIAEYFLMGKHYAIFHPLADPSKTKKYEDMRWNEWTGYVWNKFTISAVLKTVWLTLAVIWAIAFGADNGSVSACFEWLLAFWYGLLFIILSADFYVGGRYKESLYFHQIESFEGYYKYDNLISSSDSYNTSDSDGSIDAHMLEIKNQNTSDLASFTNEPIVA
ncbi:hypothetical protein TPHA_0C02620 [Tetrapisispora phaffii CBS 4417]|uniref:CWH43-like N-terminal domain-containing protein n=1 Tax=Tetrapisispora phaffii (strain ATCC 24235 / CBS 4417 / NBRC 1672 / NRRL Y-8282 / UCD 70-5) TaxID=1071381 RepID=G8BRN9_TETPH|nr:hypothetical protein TPHA_0C02620 [Tetrapisispora phaffii CBS 4417]CCE62415.1 hypothetical protein TPHA_0C02620 [Tetrapisispora phaffii CBS 4417]